MSNKTLVLGDIHGRLCWWDIINKESPDRIIFMGDYIDSHEDISAEQQCSNFEDILNYVCNNKDKCILLRGNHDMKYMGYNWARFGHENLVIRKYVNSIKDTFLNISQWVYIDEWDNIFSHAGISTIFWDNLELGEPTNENILKINDLKPSSIFGFTPKGFSDIYGTSDCQPCTWIRPETLVTCGLKDRVQVVGHSQYVTGRILDLFDDKGLDKIQASLDTLYNDEYNGDKYREQYNISDIWVVDTLPNKYMIIDEEGNKRLVDYK